MRQTLLGFQSEPDGKTSVDRHYRERFSTLVDTGGFWAARDCR